MKELILEIIYVIFFVFVYDLGLFRITENWCCKKVKGDCSKCKAWSCYKGNIEWEKEKEGKK